jgi:hypothetical protein
MHTLGALRNSRLGLLVTLLTFLALLSSCGGKAEQDSDQRLTDAIKARSPEELLKEVSLSKSDLPPGFVIVQSDFSRNEEAAARNPLEPRDDALDSFERNGRILSLESEYHPEDLAARLLSPNSMPIALVVSVTLYETTSGAADAFEFAKEMRDRWRASYVTSVANSPNFTGVRPLDGRDVRIGDDSFGFGFAAEVQFQDATVPVSYDLVAFRSGPFIAVVVTGATFATPADEADRLGGRLAALIAAKNIELAR